MEDRFNTIAGWALGAGIVALGATLLSAEAFHQGEVHHGGFPVEEATTGGGSEKPAPTDWTKADPAKGAEVFKQCGSCHTVEAGGPNKSGPNLHGIVGKAKASTAGFAYSDAIKGKGGSWTFEDMDAWLTKPEKYAPGTKMKFGGLGNDNRVSVIAYLNTQGANLPLPKNAPPEAAAAEGDKAAEAAGSAANAAAPAANAAAPAATAAAPAK